MGNAIDYFYTVFTRIMDFLSWGWDLLQSGIDFISTSFKWLFSMIHYLPLPVQGILTIFLVLGVLCLIFHR